ncbi:DUF4430 domain-containing protein [Evansella cellulosilytica]|uniref:Transcobalamin-like C-terminal domain-containing protein n=1 Tax=Evansella cellulosilytica (strain ATCC 21833 / DSM 2522 / FERM P-1141 / JCM 9156 / N-4) TaxID=649639 RepID=E6TWS8_EVAC2|nr:DUF4430 domain-containing protein [Evansella cellulosilytica]ADU28761.1 hypothetical protein Bcell_0479 [Evansella cellulosilytica DSM 2522]
MKLTKLLLALFVAMALLLVGCNQDDSEENTTPITNDPVNNTASEDANENASANESDEVKVTIVNMRDETDAEEYLFAIDEGDTVMDVMESNFAIDNNNGFIEAIDGIYNAEGETYAWMYSVNGEQPTVGAEEYDLEAGDEVLFEFLNWDE